MIDTANQKTVGYGSEYGQGSKYSPVYTTNYTPCFPVKRYLYISSLGASIQGSGLEWKTLSSHLRGNNRETYFILFSGSKEMWLELVRLHAELVSSSRGFETGSVWQGGERHSVIASGAKQLPRLRTTTSIVILSRRPRFSVCRGRNTGVKGPGSSLRGEAIVVEVV